MGRQDQSHQCSFGDRPRAWVFYGTNHEAIDYYLDTVSEALNLAGFGVVRAMPEGGAADITKGADKDDIIVVPSAIEFAKAYWRGFRRIVFWSQGVIPEESYMRNNSASRRWLLSCIERFALERAWLCLFVSKAMRRHYEGKYGISFDGRCYIMPCCGVGIRSDLIGGGERYMNPRFAYAGSLAKWQCFDKTLSFFKAIQAVLPEASLKVLTFQEKEAKTAIDKSDIKNWTLGSVPPDCVADELRDVGYGFVLREDDLVNRVSTPTKISSYVSCGVIPVFSSCIADFNEIAQESGFGCPVDAINDVERVVAYIANPPKTEDVSRICESLFSSYYSREKHASALSSLLKGLLIEQD